MGSHSFLDHFQWKNKCWYMCRVSYRYVYVLQQVVHVRGPTRPPLLLLEQVLHMHHVCSCVAFQHALVPSCNAPQPHCPLAHSIQGASLLLPVDVLFRFENTCMEKRDKARERQTADKVFTTFPLGP